MNGDDHWALSDKGAAAVLLKMDEFQGRLGTPGALIRKGTKKESTVLPPLPIPTLMQPPLAAPRPGDDQFTKKYSKALVQAIGRCKESDDDKDDPEYEVSRLSNTKMLVSTRCWLAAYNVGMGFWVINDKPPFEPVEITQDGSDYASGTISMAQKGRGLGDCWSTAEWTWNGKTFVQTKSSSSGMCKLMAPGGAWELPELITDVVPATTEQASKKK